MASLKNHISEIHWVCPCWLLKGTNNSAVISFIYHCLQALQGIIIFATHFEVFDTKLKTNKQTNPPKPTNSNNNQNTPQAGVAHFHKVTPASHCPALRGRFFGHQLHGQDSLQASRPQVHTGTSLLACGFTLTCNTEQGLNTVHFP